MNFTVNNVISGKIVISGNYHYALYFSSRPDKYMSFRTIEDLKKHLRTMALHSRLSCIPANDYHIFDKAGNAFVFDNEDLIPSESPENITISTR